MHLRTTELFSAVTRARMKSHITSYMECVTTLYKISAQWVKLSPTHFWEPSSLFSAVTRAHSKSHTTPDTECVRILHLVLAALRWIPFLEMGSPLANCVDIPSRPQGPVKEAFAFLWIGSRLPRKLCRYPFKTTRTRRRSILQTCKSDSLARWNEISFVPKLPVSKVKRYFWK